VPRRERHRLSRAVGLSCGPKRLKSQTMR